MPARTDCAVLVPADAIAAYDRLRVWETKLPNAAAMPALPAGAVGTDELALVHTNLEHCKGTTDARWKSADAEIAIRLQAFEQERTARRADQTTLDHPRKVSGTQRGTVEEIQQSSVAA